MKKKSKNVNVKKITKRVDVVLLKDEIKYYKKWCIPTNEMIKKISKIFIDKRTIMTKDQ